MRPGPLVRVFVLLGILPPALGTATGAEHALTLDEATALAIEKNQGLFIERESLAARRRHCVGPGWQALQELPLCQTYCPGFRLPQCWLWPLRWPPPHQAARSLSCSSAPGPLTAYPPESCRLQQ